MFNSKFYTVMIVLTFVMVSAAVAFQIMEMQEYDLISAIMGGK